MPNKKLDELKDLQIFQLNKPFKVEIIPNDGSVLESIGEAIITYDEEKFIVYYFKGIFKRKLTEDNLEFKFSSLSNAEFGKYGFKHPYVKLDLAEEKYLVFSYSFKIKGYAEQTKNIEGFFEILFKRQEEIAKEETVKNEDL